MGVWSGNVIKNGVPAPAKHGELCPTVSLTDLGVIISWAQLTVPNSPELTKVSLLA